MKQSPEEKWLIKRASKDLKSYSSVVHSIMKVEMEWSGLVQKGVDIDAIKKEFFDRKQNPYSCAIKIMDEFERVKYETKLP